MEYGLLHSSKVEHKERPTTIDRFPNLLTSSLHTPSPKTLHMRPFFVLLLSASAAWATPYVVECLRRGSHLSDADVLHTEAHPTQQLNETKTAFEAVSDSRTLEPKRLIAHSL